MAGEPCPVCGDGRFRFRFRAGDHDYERCTGCGFERMRDPPGGSDLDAHYREERTTGEACWQEHDRNLEKYGRMLGRLERWVRPGRMLDVGCSLGTSLVAARARGWEAVGIELSRPVAEFGRAKWDLDIRTEGLDEAGFAAGSFDLVWMHHTLEHVREPGRVLAECRRVLAPRGLMYQAMPNHGGLKSRLLGSCWSYGITPEHVSLFSRRTLRRIVRRTGFRVVRAWTTSHTADPRLLVDTMRRLGREDRLMRWCGREDGSWDQEAYLRYLGTHRLPYWICNRLWPARLTGLLGLGEEVHLVAAPH